MRTISKLCRKIGLKMPFTNLWGLISAIPHEWKETIRSTNTNYQKVESKIYPTVEHTCKRIKNILVKKNI